jgi:DNA-binding winged helix-turn-helix (wHTH) protein
MNVGRARVPLTFGDYRLDLATRQVFRGTAEVHLSPKAFDLLQCLIAHRDRAMSKAELHEHLWPDTFVTEANLASLIAEVRRALGDEPSTPKFIRTVHRFGYGFSGRVEGDAPPAPVAYTCWVVWRGEEIPLRDGENVIGRDPGVAVRLDVPSVSRRHAKLILTPDAVTLEDLGSKNGTLLRSERVAGTARVQDLDEIEIGSVRMIVRIRRGSATTETVGG